MYVRLLFVLLGTFIIFGCDNASPRTKSKSSHIENLLIESKNKELDLGRRIRLIDSTFVISKKRPLDSLYLAVIAYKATLHYKLKQRDSAFYYDNFLITKAKKINNNYYLSRGHLNLALYFEEIQISDSAFVYYNLAKNHFTKIKDNYNSGKSFLGMALIQQNKSDFFGSKETITEALKYLNEGNNLKYISSSYSVLATNHRKLLNYQDALKYYSKAINTTDSEKDKLIYQNNLAATYIDNEQYDEARALLEFIANDSLLIKNKREYTRVLDNLAYAKWLSDNADNKKEFLNPLQLRKQNNDKRGQIASYTHLGEFYTKIDSQRAISYFDSVIQVSKTLKIPRAEKDALKFLMELEPKNINIRNRYVVLQDSIYEEELKVSTRFAKYKYDDKAKQEENVRLEKENAEQELEVAKQRNQKLAFSAIGGLLLLILGFFSYYFVQRTKRLKKEKETAALNAMHETEAALSRRLHDDFGGKLNNAMVMLQNKTDTTEVLDVVDELYNQSRDFSREINVVDTGENFEEELLEMLRFRTPSDAKLIYSGIKAIKWPSIAPISKTTLFKVLQELMINMSKYSNATLISIGFSATLKTLKVDYADDGDGATTKELQTKNGLRNTEKRIQALKGSITFDSEKGNGFRAEINIPK